MTSTTQFAAGPRCVPADSVAANERFVARLPIIRRTVRCALWHTPRSVREEQATECMANAFSAFTRLVLRGKADFIYPTVLARYGLMQVRDGRKVGTRLNSHDALSRHTQKRKGLS